MPPAPLRPQADARPWLGGLTGLGALALAMCLVTGFWPPQRICQLGWLTAWGGRCVCQKRGDLFLL